MSITFLVQNSILKQVFVLDVKEYIMFGKDKIHIMIFHVNQNFFSFQGNINIKAQMKTEYLLYIFKIHFHFQISIKKGLKSTTPLDINHESSDNFSLSVCLRARNDWSMSISMPQKM